MENEQKKSTQENVDPLTKEQTELVKANINKSIDLNKVEELISHNRIEFLYDNIRYRVRKPTYRDKQIAYEQQVEKVTELVTSSNYDMEEILRAKYKKKGIDIDAMERQMVALENKKHSYQLKLGELLAKQGKDNDLQVFKDEIGKINEEQLSISIKKTNLLQYSVEQQALIYVYSYLTFLITERFENENWVKAFETFDDFMNSNEDLINKASANASLIIGRI